MVADLGSTDGHVTATAVVVAPGAGLVVRARSPSDYPGVIVDHYSGRWLLAGAVPGRPGSPSHVGTELARPGDVVQVTMAGDEVAASINAGAPVRVTAPAAADATRVGLVALLPDADTPRWRDFSATADPAGANRPVNAPTLPPATGFTP